MLRKPNRLRQSDRFIEVKRSGRSSVHYLLVLTVMPNELTHSRFGFSVSRRIGGAVERNRAKRLMREAVRSQVQYIVPGYDMVFIARKPIRGVALVDVHRAIVKLLGQAGLLLQPIPVGKTREADETDRTILDQAVSGNHLEDASL